MGVDEFIARWSGREGGAERANYAMFLTELTGALDLPRPEPADSHADYRFEFPVRGGNLQPLRIDLYKRDAFILEAKQSRLKPDKGEAAMSPQLGLFGDMPATATRSNRRARWDADMRAAFNQAWDYASRLPAEHERPPFIVTCDVGRSFEFYSDFTGQGRAYRPYPTERTRVVGLEQLVEHDTQELFHSVWERPRALDPAKRKAEATRAVAGYLAQVSRALEARGKPPEEVATFLTRVLFAMFAEDVGLLPEDSFTGLLRRCQEAPAGFAPQMSDLFQRMDEGGFSPALNVMVRRFNGAFYKERRAFDLGAEEIGALLAAAGKDWRDVEPAIFGTLLEQALDPTERTRLGAHYTPRPYVERLVQATVIEPLRQDWEASRAAAEVLQAQGDTHGAALELLAFHDQLTRTRVLDPACGTGNFLYVTLELMKSLEAEVLDARAALLDDAGGELMSDEVLRGVDPRRFYGLELNPRAAAITELVLWIGYLQASYRRDANYSPRTPVLEDYGTINPVESRARPADRSVDAVLQSDGDVIGGGGVSYPRARLPAWPEAEFIVGNPPFTGAKYLRREQGNEYIEALWRLHPHMDRATDLVLFWWDRAAHILTSKGSKLRRFGLVTTNSITQVLQRRTVERWLGETNPNRRPLSLIWAVDDHPWTKATQDTAAVRIAMTVAQVGVFEGRLGSVIRQDRLETDQPEVELTWRSGRINADLTVGVDLLRAQELDANRGLCSPGVKLHGAGFILRRSEAEHLGLGRRLGLEAHIRPYMNGRDLTGRSRNAWVIDLFGLGSSEVRERFPEVYQHVAVTVKPERDVNNRATYRDQWWLFGEPRREMRPALAGLPRYVATGVTQKHRTFSFISGDVLPDDALMVIATTDEAHLAVLSSLVHQEWAVRTGAWLGVGNDSRYIKSRCFDPFPFPAWTPEQHAALAAAGGQLDAFRKARLAEQPDLTLTRLYNALEAHRLGKAPNDGMTPEEAADFQRASVVALADIHAEIDRLTFDAYGWPTDLAGDALLARVVALNAERRTEERRGEVRWLRPAYQRPRFAREKLAGAEHAGDLVAAASVVAAERAPWPKKPREQVLEIKVALAEAGGLDVDALTARFKGRAVAAEVPRVLRVLQSGGQVRRAPDGAYSLLRAA